MEAPVRKLAGVSSWPNRWERWGWGLLLVLSAACYSWETLWASVFVGVVMSMLRRPILVIGLGLLWIAVSTALMINGNSPVSLRIDLPVDGRYERVFIVTAEERYELELGVIRDMASAGQMGQFIQALWTVREAKGTIPVRWSVSSFGGEVITGGGAGLEDLARSDVGDYLHIGGFRLPRGVYRFTIEITTATPGAVSYLGEVRSWHNFKIENTWFSVAVALSFALSIYAIAPFLIIYAILQVWERIRAQPRSAG